MTIELWRIEKEEEEDIRCFYTQNSGYVNKINDLIRSVTLICFTL